MDIALNPESRRSDLCDDAGGLRLLHVGRDLDLVGQSVVLGAPAVPHPALQTIKFHSGARGGAFTPYNLIH